MDRRAALLALILPLVAGCSALPNLASVTEAADLYDLTPKSTYDPDLPQIHSQVVVEEPTAASAVNTDRIAVRPNSYQVQYFPDARWVDRAPLMVQTLLVESFESTGKITSVGRQAIGLRADYTLVIDLREFQAVVGEGEAAPITAVVQLNLKIVREPEGTIIASQSFLREVEAKSPGMIDVVAAFDAALGKAMGRAVDWTLREIAAVGG